MTVVLVDFLCQVSVHPKHPAILVTLAQVKNDRAAELALQKTEGGTNYEQLPNLEAAGKCRVETGLGPG